MSLGLILVVVLIIVLVGGFSGRFAGTATAMAMARSHSILRVGLVLDKKNPEPSLRQRPLVRLGPDRWTDGCFTTR
jgi:hypothetical protein